MSSHTAFAKSTTKIDEKYNAMQDAALRYIQDSKMRKNFTTPCKTTSPPPIDDFVLFPDDTTTERHPRRRRKTHHKTATCVTQYSKHDHAVAKRFQQEAKTDSPRPARHRVARHGGFRIEPLLDNDDENDKSHEEMKQNDVKARMNKPPPAPSPPKLDSPDLSEVDEDEFWPCQKAHGHGIVRRTAA